MSGIYEVIHEKTIVTTYHVDIDLNIKSLVEYFDIVDNCLHIQLTNGKELCYLVKQAIDYNSVCEETVVCDEIDESLVDKENPVCSVKKHVEKTKE